VSAKIAGRFAVISNIEVGPCVFRLDFDAPEIAQLGKPGQFVMVRPDGRETAPLLPRPLSLYRMDKEKGQAALLYKVVGEGTRELSRVQAGERLSVTGPLGRGFEINDNLEAAYLVAGGMGVAPLAALAEVLFKDSVYLTVFYGVRSTAEVIPAVSNHFEQFSNELVMTGEEGIPFGPWARSYQGLVTEPPADWLTGDPRPIFACGPRPMLKRVAELAKEFNVPAQVSLETHMACGFGVCQGCVTELLDRTGAVRWGRVCTEGPVFPAEEVAW